ncbi:hypothetical protein DPMN_115060 [Dreissena polymorpha]|uniref:Uncharacterized protein n=1 Tax=Dreissena polymorpha TaxID=45954 RepID=A0A9D4QS47_DREPO|nr:hypothetical protein DPMN_115060 [Dreissena polymorpha]
MSNLLCVPDRNQCDGQDDCGDGDASASQIFRLVTNVTSRENAPRPPDSHDTNVLTKFHKNWAKHVTRVFTCFYYIHIEKTGPPNGGHVFFTDLDYFRTRPKYQLKRPPEKLCETEISQT